MNFRISIRCCLMNALLSLAVGLTEPGVIKAEPAAGSIRIFTAKKIITMNPSQPKAQAVAVRDGRILSVGLLKDMQSWLQPGAYEIDPTFEDKTVTPGLIDAHCHLQLGASLWQNPYIGYYDRYTPNGTLVKGNRSKDEAVTRLRELESQLTESDRPLIAWGYDPLLVGGLELTVVDLDSVSKPRPILVLQLSGHVAYGNSALLQMAHLTSETKTEGVVKGADGNPTGELHEFAAMAPALAAVGKFLFDPARLEEATSSGGRLALGAGVTTATDLAFGTFFEKEGLAAYQKVLADPRFPVRVILAYAGDRVFKQEGADKAAQYILDLMQRNTDKLRVGPVKFFVDGSIQGGTGRLNWPGYFNGRPNGLFNADREALKQMMLPFHKAGLQIHAHANADEATDVALEVLEYLQTQAYRPDHRYTLEHNQMATPSQYQRMANLGGAANIFVNHLYYWGDVHSTQTMGPDRANRAWAAATAKRLGVHFSFHSDMPVTPLGPLFSVWAAVNRQTASGQMLGEAERISVEDALRAVTLEAAYLLKMENEIGSIEVGKLADFTVLEQDPLSTPRKKLKDIPIWGTVLGGVAHPAR